MPDTVALDRIAGTIGTYANQAKEALGYITSNIDAQRYPGLVARTSELQEQFDRAAGHCAGLVGVVRQAVGTISPQERDVLRGKYMGIEDRLLNNEEKTLPLLEEVGKLAQEHPEFQQLTSRYNKVRSFYDRAVEAVNSLKPIRDQGFQELTPTDRWYDRVPILRSIAHSSKGRLMRIGLGLIFAMAGIYLYRWYRKRHADTHSLTHLEPFS